MHIQPVIESAVIGNASDPLTATGIKPLMRYKDASNRWARPLTSDGHLCEKGIEVA
jgi:hypothetical protein